MKTAKKKILSRWGLARGTGLTRGTARYDAKQQAEIDKKYHEPFGWHNGAKVRRK